MPDDLSGLFRITAEVTVKYGQVSLVLNASNEQEGNLLKSRYRISDIRLDLKGMNFTIPRRKFNRMGEMEGAMKLEDKESSAHPTKIFVPSVFMGYSLEASFQFQDIIIQDHNNYSGAFILSFTLLGPGPLPDIGEEEVAGAFHAVRAEQNLKE